jgi:RNA recognition motif-containing protein
MMDKKGVTDSSGRIRDDADEEDHDRQVVSSRPPPNTASSDEYGDSNDDYSNFKVHISRVPTKFTEDIVKRILLTKMDCSENCIVSVELVYPRNDPHKNDDDTPAFDAEKGGTNDDDASPAKVTSWKREDYRKTIPDDNTGDDSPIKEHRGFGFVTFSSHELMEGALNLQTIKGGRKVTSKKQHTIYIRPYVVVENSPTSRTRPNDDSRSSIAVRDGHDVCYLWSLHRCPYGDGCKFRHVGEGGCIAKTGQRDGTNDEEGPTKKKGKCFAYKKGKCSKGDECPFSHDFEPSTATNEKTTRSERTGEAVTCTIATTIKNFPIQIVKDCINWKSKGVCKKGDKCPYRHDLDLQKKALQKRELRKNSNGNDKESIHNEDGSSGKQRKEKQPLSVRVFGLNYETTEHDVREFFQECGKINDINFPSFEDSGRSKGYCAVWFTSPKAVVKALELDGQELHGRWLRIQSGKMMNEWEQLHPPLSSETASSGMGQQRKRFKYDPSVVPGLPPSLAVE